MNPVDLTIPFGLGLVSSLHCIQMCGPMVVAYSIPLHRAGRPLALAHVAYNLGRILTYAALGAVAGALGKGMLSLGRLAGLERAAILFAGIAMIVAGLLMTGWLQRPELVRIGGGIPVLYSRTVGRLVQSTGAVSKLLLGMILGLLPCGMVYAALLKAVDSGTALGGALSMLAFGAGTAGTLLGIGVFSSAITARLGRHANTIAAISVIAVGVFLVYRGLHALPTMARSCHG